MASRTGTSASPPRPRGRPRRAGVDHAVLQAALELVAGAGYQGLTMEALAERAGVGKATIYRRWQSRDDVLEAAAAAFVSEIEVPDTGSVREDLLALAGNAIRVYRGVAGRAMPGLVAAMARNPVLASTVRDGLLAARRRALRAVLERGIARGELRPDTDVEIALDVMGGPLFYRLLITGAPVNADVARRVVDVLLHGIARDGATPTGGRS